MLLFKIEHNQILAKYQGGYAKIFKNTYPNPLKTNAFTESRNSKFVKSKV